jgi:hypothetical protein
MSFLEEVRELYKNRAVKRQEDKLKEETFKDRLLKLNEDALNEYYEKCKNSVRSNIEDLFCCYIYDDDKFDVVHQIMKQKFMDDGITVVESRRGPYVRGFDLKI